VNFTYSTLPLLTTYFASTKENKYATLLAKAGNNNAMFTYWVRDCSVENQPELKGKDELAKYVEAK
jgi:hypothetical protein